MKITAHTLVKNEGRFLWFAVASVINYVDRVLLWDTGSDDISTDIEGALTSFSGKVDYKQMGEVDVNSYTELRQKMIDETNGGWILILDGDEVWWERSIANMSEKIEKEGKCLDSIVVGYRNMVGDLFHYEPEKEGRYQIDGKLGNITIRAINTSILALHTKNPHGQHGYFDGQNVLLQERDPKRRFHMPGVSYLHMTHLPRAFGGGGRDVPKRSQKLRREIGKELPLDYYYPEVFFRERPDFIPSPWIHAPSHYKLQGSGKKILRSVKRSVIKSSGY